MPLDPDQQEQANIMAEALRQAFNPAVNDRLQLGIRQPPQPEQHIECVSPSGAHFTARVVASREFPQGRVIGFVDGSYLYPPHPILKQKGFACHEGPEKFEWPRGMTVLITGGEMNGQFTLDAKTYLTQTTWLRDLREYVGKGLDPFIRADRQKDIKKFHEQQAAEHAKFMAAAQQPEPEPAPAPKK